MLEIQDLEAEVRLIRMRRPPANALNPELIAALTHAIRQAPDDGVRSVVLSGSPGMFSGGLDVPALIGLSRAEIHAAWEDFYSLLQILTASPIPIAAAITGHSPAGGAVLAIFCDYRVMARGPFKIGLNEVRVSIALPSALYGAFEQLVGARTAARMAVEGALVDPEGALRIGLVDELAEAQDTEAFAISWCRSLLPLPPLALARTRAMTRSRLGSLLAERRDVDVRLAVERWFEAETQAGLQSLVANLARKTR